MAKRKKKSLFLIPEPNWTELSKLTDNKDREDAFQSVSYFVHSEIDTKSKCKAMKKWIKEESGWTEEEIKYTTTTGLDPWLQMSGKYCWVYYKLGYMPEGPLKYLHTNRKEEFLKLGKKYYKETVAKKEAKGSKKVISIQERMFEQVSELMGDWECIVDNFIDNQDIDIKSFDPYKSMQVYKGGVIKPAHAKIIKTHLQNHIEEAQEVLDWKDPDIKEGYSHFNSKMRKQYLEFYQKIDIACDTFIETGKAKRKPRKPKVISREKIVSKLKYQLNDSELGIASINPAEIIDAEEVWVYNTKTRKIGVYKKADLSGGLTVRGTSIYDYEEGTSVQKTLRKPAVQLKEFKGAAKTKMNNAFSSIKATEIKLSGRVSDTIIILKAF
jgi:hypothetical protein